VEHEARSFDCIFPLLGSDTWKRIAGELGIPNTRFDYYDRMKNPVEGLLDDACKKRLLTVGELYDILVKCDANAVADSYL
jgi:hypothetical protein